MGSRAAGVFALVVAGAVLAGWATPASAHEGHAEGDTIAPVLAFDPLAGDDPTGLWVAAPGSSCAGFYVDDPAHVHTTEPVACTHGAESGGTPEVPTDPAEALGELARRAVAARQHLLNQAVTAPTSATAAAAWAEVRRLAALDTEDLVALAGALRREADALLAAEPASELVPAEPASGTGGWPTGANGLACIGTGKDGPRVQATYVVASDRTDHFASVAGSLGQWAVTNVQDPINIAAQSQGEQRLVRFVTSSGSSGCTLDVLKVVVPPEGDDTFAKAVAAVRNAGHNRTDRKYLVWLDAQPSSGVCGQGHVYNDARKTGNYNDSAQPAGMFAMIFRSCWGDVAHPTEAHELLHTMGAVQSNSPNHSVGWHCLDEWDVMCYDDDGGGPQAVSLRCPSLTDAAVDCGKDDYFNVTPGGGTYLAESWNVADSIYLAEAASGGTGVTTTTTVPTGSPTGSLQPLVRSWGVVRVRGIASEPDAPGKAATVNVLVNGIPRLTLATDAVTGSFAGKVPAPAGATVCVVAVNLQHSVGLDTLLGCRTL